jgi:subtilisin family serine protease/uncharacterized protein YdeI (BOF family)
MNPRLIAQCKPLAALLMVLILVPLGAALGADTSPRAFAPVQGGFVEDAPTALPYHPGRILIQLTSQSFEEANLHFSMEKGASAPSASTGLPSVDALCASSGVMSISRPYIQVKNTKTANELGLERWYMLETDGSADPLAMAEQFSKDSSIQEATVDWIAFPAAIPSDPLYDDHWGHNNTAQMISYDWSVHDHVGPTVGTVGFDANAQAAWDEAQGYGNSSVVIAIIDSGVEVGHPDLTQVTGYDFGDNDTNPDDNSSQPGHGTACAGVAASKANNGLGATGVAPNCAIMPLKVADSAGSMSFSSIQNALYYAADNGADIISMSLGAAISSDSATDAAILYAYNAGCTILAATGNENMSTISYPAINQYVIAVGAASPCGERKRASSSSTETNPGVSTDPNGYTCDGERWWGSNYGSTTQDAGSAVDVIAPTILPTTDLLGSAGYDSSDYSMWFNGTSCATPYAAGVAALVKSAFPAYTPAQIRDKITSTAQDVTSVESGSGWDRYAGYGLVDAAAAVGGAPVNNPPVAAFNGSPLSGDFPLLVSFTDASSNTPTSWSWTFGDGGTSSAQNPSHTYTAAGNYTVSLTASNAYGSDGETKTGYITVTTPQTGGDYATLPYTAGFEGGAFDQYWTSTSNNTGRIQLTTANTPHSGSYHMTMDCSSNGTYSTNEGWLHLDLTGQSQVDMTYWWKDFSDETHTGDGVYFSSNGGTSFVKVQDLNGASYTNNVWRQWDLDVTALAAANGLSLSSTFVIKFQQYDNYMATTDGMAFDDISVVGSIVVPDEVTVTYPNGGETLTGGGSANITWTSAGSFTTVDIDYSTNGGSTWVDVVNGTANDGAYTWSVPSVATTQGQIRIVGGTASDASNANFTITYTAPTVTVTYPNGGETLTGGGSANITWTSGGAISTVDIDYSTNGGTSWTDIVDGTTNDGSYTWSVPAVATTQGQVRIVGGTATDTSNANFTIDYTPPAGDYATVPYSTGFETGSLDQYWSTASTGNGRIQVFTSYTPHGGSYQLAMDCSVSGTYSYNEANLALNLAGETEVDLNFWWKEFGDETHAGDGIYFSANDGATFVKVQDLNGSSYTNQTWQYFSLDVDALAAANGLTMSSTFVVKFQQYDNYTMTSDGFTFDDIEVVVGSGGGTGGTAITVETEPNASTGEANGPVGDGVVVSGTISSSSDDDYFWFDVDTAGNINISVAIGSSADLDWYLYNSAGTQVDRGYTTANPEAGSYTAAVGRYYVRVDGYNGATSSYTLTVDGGLALLNEAPEKQDMPAMFALQQNSPNPFNPMTKIAFDLPKSSQVRLRIFDSRGHVVRTLVNESMGAGSQSVIWNGLDDTGGRAHSGVYYYMIEAEDFQATRKMTLLK